MSFGLDPEFFIVDGRNHLIPAADIIPEDESANGVAFDGAAVELNPARGRCLVAWLGNVRETMRRAYFYMRLKRARNDISSKAHFSFAPSVYVHENLRTHPSMQEFGCNPAFIYTGPDSEPVLSYTTANPLTATHRTAGFHIHHSVPSEAMTDDHLSAMLMTADHILGLVDVIMCNRFRWKQQSYIRRNTFSYGLPTEHRTRYNDVTAQNILEYRAMSPWPLMHPIWTYWAVSVFRQIVSRTPHKTLVRFLREAPDWGEVVGVMMTGSLRGAQSLLKASLKTWIEVYSMLPRADQLEAGSNCLTPTNIEALKPLLFTPTGFKAGALAYNPIKAWHWEGRPNYVHNRRRLQFNYTTNKYENKWNRKYVRNDELIVHHERGMHFTFPTGGVQIAKEIGA